MHKITCWLFVVAIVVAGLAAPAGGQSPYGRYSGPHSLGPYSLGVCLE